MIPQSNAQSEGFGQQPVLQRSGQYFVPSRPETRENTCKAGMFGLHEGLDQARQQELTGTASKQSLRCVVVTIRSNPVSLFATTPTQDLLTFSLPKIAKCSGILPTEHQKGTLYKVPGQANSGSFTG